MACTISSIGHGYTFSVKLQHHPVNHKAPKNTTIRAWGAKLRFEMGSYGSPGLWTFEHLGTLRNKTIILTITNSDAPGMQDGYQGAVQSFCHIKE